MDVILEIVAFLLEALITWPTEPQQNRNDG